MKSGQFVDLIFTVILIFFYMEYVFLVFSRIHYFEDCLRKGSNYVDKWRANGD